MAFDDHKPAMPDPIRGVLLDGDGVVFDSEELSILAFLRTLEEFNIVYTRPECGRFIGRGTAELLADINGEHGCRIGLDDYVRRRDAMYERCCHEVDGPRPMAGIRELLDLLGAIGIPYAIASSASPGKLAFNLDRSGLRPRFPVTVNGEEVARGKPAPDIFVEAARRLGVDIGGCVVLEDSVNGLRGAIAAGAVPIAIEGSHPREELAALTSRIYKHPGEFAAALGEGRR